MEGDRAVTTALASMSAAEREAVCARVVDERDYDEIAGALGCSESVVRQRVSRGLSRARRRLTTLRLEDTD